MEHASTSSPSSGGGPDQPVSEAGRRKIAEARRNIWKYGVNGMVLGAVAGMAYFPLVRRFRRRWRWGKEGTMAVLGTAAAGSFLAARYKAADLRGILKELRESRIAEEARGFEEIQERFDGEVQRVAESIQSGDAASEWAPHDHEENSASDPSWPLPNQD
ncbi:hypothetical protein FNF28_03530 [Cafeteria roenbergensis]|uniref:Uncharacterized protein n=2 Tax=Cafeteria roenbergensis TaxID=33653 RepID=A0A5A8DJD7_CAFRO|nr:hypothetical protein FNF28_03530 [Cafeteria roenbergensis]